MTTRRARPKEFLPIAALDREAWKQNRNPEFIPDGEHVWRHWCEDALVYVAVERDRIVGAALAFPTLNDRFCLHKMFVASEHRGKRIGRELMEAILVEIDRHRQPCYLTVDPANKNAVVLYKQLGFTDEELVKRYYRPNEDRLVLTRPVST